MRLACILAILLLTQGATASTFAQRFGQWHPVIEKWMPQRQSTSYRKSVACSTRKSYIKTERP